jgi:hypothetical protein
LNGPAHGSGPAPTEETARREGQLSSTRVTGDSDALKAARAAKVAVVERIERRMIWCEVVRMWEGGCRRKNEQERTVVEQGRSQTSGGSLARVLAMEIYRLHQAWDGKNRNEGEGVFRQFRGFDPFPLSAPAYIAPLSDEGLIGTLTLHRPPSAPCPSPAFTLTF